MNKFIKLSVYAIIFFVAIFIVYFFSTVSFYENKAPSNTAVWKGAADFGCWYDVVYVDSIKHIARIKVYHDYDNGMWIDEYYYDRKRVIIPFNRLNILNSIFDFDTSTGYIILLSGDSLCFDQKNS